VRHHPEYRYRRGICPFCGCEAPLRLDGSMRSHPEGGGAWGPGAARCPGSYTDPVVRLDEVEAS
jgi:hypothetical protein